MATSPFPSIAINADTASIIIKPGQSRTFGLGSLFIYSTGDNPITSTAYGAVLGIHASGGNYAFDGVLDISFKYNYVTNLIIYCW
jgi:hypothetical protein